MKKKRAALHNLGCKVNAYETEAMQQILESAGYEIVPFQEVADVYVVNTCLGNEYGGPKIQTDAPPGEKEQSRRHRDRGWLLRADERGGGTVRRYSGYCDRK